MGQTALQQGRYPQAQALAAKSDALAGNDASLRARNAWLSGAARQAAGQNLAPPAIDREQRALQDRLAQETERRRLAEAQAATYREQLSRERASHR